jgi:putative SOS response-associated peptidase YedK
MCNLYSVTKGQAAIISLSRAMRDCTVNSPPHARVIPDSMAPIVRNAPDGVRELTMARWGMPSTQRSIFEAAAKRAEKLEKKESRSGLLRTEPDGGTMNIRDTKSLHWRRWLGVEHRCVVPFTSFSEFVRRQMI